MYTDDRPEVEKIEEFLRPNAPEHIVEEAFEFYHRHVDEDRKQSIQDRINNGSLRGVAATDALRMGMDFKRIMHIILWLCPRSFLSLVQKIGRCGRLAELLGEAILYITSAAYMCHEINVEILQNAALDDVDDDENSSEQQAVGDGEQMDRDAAVEANDEVEQQNRLFEQELDLGTKILATKPKKRMVTKFGSVYTKSGSWEVMTRTVGLSNNESWSPLDPRVRDRRFRAMSPCPSLCHFKKGIALTSQWTGTERKNMEKVFLGVLANAPDPAVQRTVRGIIHFIFYTHFETHCDESLALMDAAWAAFHDNKDIFILLEIHKHFDINKLHKIKHYTDSIRSRGTADGFNTENTERLHIDLVKIGYSTTNKKAYTRQMTVWLRHQEAVYKFGMYLQWTVPGYIADIESAEAGKIDDGDDPPEPVPLPQEHEDSDDEGELEEPHGPIASVPTDSVAKKPATSHDVQYKIKAVKSVRQAKPGQFDTILARVHPRADGMSLTDSLRVARVRVIFRLPDDFGIYADPLAYVDWFQPLQSPVANVGMHQVLLSSRSHHQNSSIIPITDIAAEERNVLTQVLY
ncbi:hypothetical protein B0H10DRAFT_2197355 [Mycena sp. CBHHK59/15]|nr:hypothetical protein B0H10DRAFT_2197355 [Mycena sp. CBHHK59/15]